MLGVCRGPALLHCPPQVQAGLPDGKSHILKSSLTTLLSRVLITSEEQFKLFLLPQLKPCDKYKLTAHEGIRVRRVRSASRVSISRPTVFGRSSIVTVGC